MNKHEAAVWSEYQIDVAAQWHDGDFERIYQKWCSRPEDFNFIKEYSMKENFERDLRKIKEDSYRIKIENRYHEFKRNGLTSAYLDNLMAEITKIRILKLTGNLN